MEIRRSLVIGRLDPETIRARWLGSSSSAERLGLAPCADGGVEQPVATEADEPRQKGTFRLPSSLLHHLKAYAKVREQFQYQVVAEALKGYLDEVVLAMGHEERQAMVGLQQQYGEQAIPPQASAAAEDTNADCHPPATEDSGYSDYCQAWLSWALGLGE